MAARHFACSGSWTATANPHRVLDTDTDPEAGGFLDCFMIGAEPNTGWLDGCLELDAKEFVVTGRAPDGPVLTSPYATSKPGIFAIGDVRSGSVKRVASGVGEGSVVIQAVHKFLNPTPA